MPELVALREIFDFGPSSIMKKPEASWAPCIRLGRPHGARGWVGFEIITLVPIIRVINWQPPVTGYSNLPSAFTSIYSSGGISIIFSDIAKLE